MTSNETNSSNRTRRRVLQWATALGVVGAAGCSGTGDGDDPGETTTPTPTPTSTETTKTQSKTTETPPETPAESWPLYSHDFSNTGTNQSSFGPKDDVEARWTFETDGAVRSSPALVRGTVYVGSDDGNVYAIDAKTGEERWAFQTDGPVVSSPAVWRDAVYVGSDDRHVYALDARTGEERWRYETGDRVRSPPTVDSNRKLRELDPIVAIGSDDASIYLLDAVTGKENEVFSGAGPVVTAPVVYYGASPPEIGWGDVDGLHWWAPGLTEDPYVNPGAPLHSSITVNATVNNWYQGTDDGVLHRMGEPPVNEWTFETGGKIRSSPALAAETVYVGSRDGAVYAVDAEAGDQQWAFETGEKVDSSPAVADGTVYVGSSDQHVYGLDGETGDDLWAFETGGEVRSSPAVVEGTVYVGSSDHTVYALTES